jgi:GGDEF domain-containing protein
MPSGGDEFAILLTPLSQVGEAEDVVTRIQQAMADPVVLGTAASWWLPSASGSRCIRIRG